MFMDDLAHDLNQILFLLMLITQYMMQTLNFLLLLFDFYDFV
jgi:hypothetical protein